MRGRVCDCGCALHEKRCTPETQTRRTSRRVVMQVPPGASARRRHRMRPLEMRRNHAAGFFQVRLDRSVSAAGISSASRILMVSAWSVTIVRMKALRYASLPSGRVSVFSSASTAALPLARIASARGESVAPRALVFSRLASWSCSICLANSSLAPPRSCAMACLANAISFSSIAASTPSAPPSPLANSVAPVPLTGAAVGSGETAGAVREASPPGRSQALRESMANNEAAISVSFMKVLEAGEWRRPSMGL